MKINNNLKKFIAGMFLVVGGMIPIQYNYLWFPALVIGWTLLFHWAD